MRMHSCPVAFASLADDTEHGRVEHLFSVVDEHLTNGIHDFSAQSDRPKFLAMRDVVSMSSVALETFYTGQQCVR